MTDNLIIRPARAQDRPAVEHICEHTWEDGDYVPDVWDEWLADPQGALVVGEIDGRVVALDHIVFRTPDEAWLEGMRVDPEFRLRGIARQFTVHALDYAQEHGARVARLATGHHNEPIHKLMAESGLQRVGEGALFSAGALLDGPPPVMLASQHAAQAQGFLDHSQVLAHMHGLYFAAWLCRVLSPAHLAELLSAGHIAGVLSPQGDLEALAVARSWPGEAEEDLWIGLADSAGSEPAPITALATALRTHAARLGLPRASAMLPAIDWLRDAFRAAGYDQGEWKGEMWIFEKWF